MDYITWIKIVAMAVRMVQEPAFEPYFDNIKGELAEILPDTVKKYELQYSLKPQTGEPAEEKQADTPDDLKKKQDKGRSGENDTLKKPGEEGTGDDRDQNAEAAAPFPWEEPGYSMDEPFPDYTPKLSPDNVLDYMPSLADELGSLPEVSAANLPQYLEPGKYWSSRA